MNKGSNNSAREDTVRPAEPDIYTFHDYREYLKALFEYRKSEQPGFSLRSLGKEAELAVGYLSMFFSGIRSLSTEATAKLARALGVRKRERAFLELLRTIAESDSPKIRQEALAQAQRSRAYRHSNPREFEVYRYLSRWYYVAIREMATMEGFRADVAWIQKRLLFKVPSKEIEGALAFLSENGFLKLNADGTATLPEKDVRCMGGVYRMAIGQFHREALGVVAEAVDRIPAAERSITGHCMAISVEDFDEVKRILDEALERVAEVGRRNGKLRDTVYHVVFGAVPLTSKKIDGEDK